MDTERAPARALALDRLREALSRRRGEPIGSPLQALYQDDYATPTEATATTFWGDRLQVVLPELVSCEIHRHGVIEPGLTALFIEVLQPGDVVYDVGAHLGYYSLLAAFLEANVHAFEPSRATLPLLRGNVGDVAVVNPIGLWSEETTLEFNDFGRARSALNTFVSSRDPSADPESSYRCKVTTLDAYVRSTGIVPGFIKIDAEGAELEVLRGATQTIASSRPLITIEVGDVVGGESRPAIDFAIECGYEPFEMTPDGTRPHEVRDTYSYGNILLLPDPRPGLRQGSQSSPG